MHRPQAPRERRWTQHRWNNHLSLPLIRSSTPRLRGPLLHGAHWLTTAVCYAAMGRERRASLANRRRVSSERGLRLWRRSFALFYNFSRFMVSRLDLPHLSTPQLLGRVVNLEEARSALRAALGDDSGAVVATAHLGNWEMGVHLLRLGDRPVHVVMMADGDGGIEREYERLRAIESAVSERPDQWFNFYPVWQQDCPPSRAAKS